MRTRGIVVAVMMAATLLGGCGGDDEESTAGTTQATAPRGPAGDVTPPTVPVKTTDYGFEVPPQFRGGLVTLEVDNSAGKEAHEASLVRLEQGKTLADLQQAMRQGGGPPPSWVVNAGGPGPVMAGRKATYTANLQPGTYAFLCFVHSSDGQSHVAKDMVASATVVEGPAGTLPRADATVTARDYEFAGLDGLKSGNQTVRVENQGQLEHNWGIFGLRPGRSAEDLATFLAGGGTPTGPPPFTSSPGLVGALPRSGEAMRTLELKPGRYAMVCLVRDADGRAHYQKGMLREFTVG